MATVKLPGMKPLQTGLVFGLLWLLIAGATLWKQNSVTAACTLFLEQARKTAKSENGLRSIVGAVKQRRGAMAQASFAELAGLARKLCSFKLGEIRRWADSLLIVPPLLQEGLSVDEAAQRSAKMIEPLRRMMAYPFFRRFLAFALVLTTGQVMLVIWGITLDRGRRGLPETIIMMLPLMLALCFTAFSLSLKSSIEQAVLYFTARQALGEGAAETAGLPFRQDVEAGRLGLWPSLKTYAPTCALLLLMGCLQFQKFPLMSVVINQNAIYTVKALQAAGVPLPFWSVAGSPPTDLLRWPSKLDDGFQPYGPHIISSLPMTKFLIEKGVDVNTRIDIDGSWTPPGIGNVVMTPLHLALTDRWSEGAQLLGAQLLIAHGADVHALDSIGRSPLTVAITYCPSAIELLLASGVDINEQTRFGPPLLAAARYQFLYTAERHINERENAVKILLEKGADPNTRDSEQRNALMVMSMEHRSSGDVISLGPRREVALGKFLRLYTEMEPDRALRLIGEALLQAKCDINAADSNGRTPLMYAARYGRPTAVQLLLEAGANINAQDQDGMTALDLASKLGAKEFGKEDVISLLVSAGAKPRDTKKPVGSPVKPAE
jgi:ankyrin repeat protein